MEADDPWRAYVAVLRGIARDTQGKFFAFCARMFFRRYAAASYYDAAVWGRRAAEVYCHCLLEAFGASPARYTGLGEMSWELPEWVWRPGAHAHVAAYGHVDGVLGMGLHLSASSVYDDLEVLRRYGNRGSHVSEYLSGARLGPHGPAVVSMLRLSYSLLVWRRRCSNL